jgi:PEP-CTERM motif
MKGAERTSMARSLVLTVASLLALAAPSHAGLITFLQFAQQDVNGQNFVYTNPSGQTATFASIAGGNPVRVDIASQIRPGGLAEFQNAHLSLSSSTSSPAALLPFNILSEPFPSQSNTLQFTLDTPFHGHTNLLTVTYNGLLSGQLGSRSAGVLASQSAKQTNFVQFSSDVLDLTGWTNFGFALSFSSVIATNGSGDGLTLGAGGLFESFNTAGTGTFNAATPIPEPATLTLLGLGAILGTAGWVGGTRLRARFYR